MRRELQTTDRYLQLKLFIYWFPAQKGHEEDPLQNISNGPIYGYELGHFDSGETITYWIIAYDVANNSIESYEKSFTTE